MSENNSLNNKIPNLVVQELKAKVDLVEYISSFQCMEKKDDNYHSDCPICGSKSSFVIYSKSNSFYCSSCASAGDIITYLIKTKKMDYRNAVKELALLAGENIEMFEELNLSDLMRDTARYYHAQLRETPESKKAIEILHAWGIRGKTIVQLGLGFHDSTFNSFINFMTKQKGYSTQNLENAKLVFTASNGNLCDKMMNSIIIPTINENGKVVCFDYYVINKDQHFKYPNTDDFQRADNLYSYNLAVQAGKQSVIIVSSYEDYFKLMGKGITNVVSTYFRKITEQQMKLLKKKFKVVLLLTKGYSNVPYCKTYCHKNNMYCEEFNIYPYETIVDFIDSNEDQIKDRIDYFENIFVKKQ